MSRLALAGALLLILSGSASAQLPTAPGVTITLPSAEQRIDAGNETILAGTVTNTGSLQGTVTIDAPTLDGWAIDVEPASFNLPAGASQDFQVTLVAPAAGVGAATGGAVFTATIADGAGQTAEAAATVPLARVDPAPPPPPPAGPDPLLVGGLVAAAVLLVAGVAVVVWRRRSAERARVEAAARAAWLARETGIEIPKATGPFPFGTRREMTYRVEVRNASDRPRVAVLSVAEVSEGWTAAVSLPKVPLSPGENAAVSIYVACSDAVPAKTKGRIVLAAKPEEALEKDERITLEPEAPPARVPESAHAGIVPGEGGVPRPMLRR